MRAVWYERNGPAAEVLVAGDMPDPQPGAGELRVRVACSGVNPSDVKRRAGSNNPPLAWPRAIPGMDGAGVVDALGAGVDAGWLGRRVWLHSTAIGRPFGTCAQFTVTTPGRCFALPGGTTMAEGASLGVPALTAHRALFAHGPIDGCNVLVTGGAGAVGFYAIQLARHAGARVVATVSRPAKAEAARRAGAHAVVDYRRDDVVAAVRDFSGGRGVDRIVEVDFGANLATSLQVIAEHGCIAAYASMGEPRPSLPFYDFSRRNVTLMPFLVYAMPQAAIAQAGCDVNAWLESGTAAHQVAERFALARTVAAHEAVESGRMIGKVVIDVDPSMA